MKVVNLHIKRGGRIRISPLPTDVLGQTKRIARRVDTLSLPSWPIGNQRRRLLTRQVDSAATRRLSTFLFANYHRNQMEESTIDQRPAKDTRYTHTRSMEADGRLLRRKNPSDPHWSDRLPLTHRIGIRDRNQTLPLFNFVSSKFKL